jgi:hypothetical protein
MIRIDDLPEIWAFTESDGAQCYVTVSHSPDGRTVTGLGENYYELSPEQYMLGEYCGHF